MMRGARTLPHLLVLEEKPTRLPLKERPTDTFACSTTGMHRSPRCGLATRSPSSLVQGFPPRMPRGVPVRYSLARGTLQVFLVPGCLAGSDPQQPREVLVETLDGVCSGLGLGSDHHWWGRSANQKLRASFCPTKGTVPAPLERAFFSRAASAWGAFYEAACHP